ncbi:MAG: hypothetical protein ACFE8M_08375 [Candidatus Hermodarchaeota archaeon]
MGGFGKKLKKGFAKVAGGVVEDITGSEAVGKGVEKGVKKGSVKKGIKKTIKEGKEEIIDNAKDALEDV